MVFLVISAMVLLLLTHAAYSYRQLGVRALRAGAHSLTAIQRRTRTSGLESPAGDVTTAADRDETASGREAGTEIGNVVRSHHVLSGKLMDESTRRLWPADRHRVPPWVIAPEHARVQPSSSEWEAGAPSSEQSRVEWSGR